MPRIRTLTDIPESEVDEVAGDFESEGAQVEREKQENGLWTLRATFPDSDAG